MCVAGAAEESGLRKPMVSVHDLSVSRNRSKSAGDWLSFRRLPVMSRISNK